MMTNQAPSFGQGKKTISMTIVAVTAGSARQAAMDLVARTMPASPSEVAAVDDDASKRRTVTAHKFGQRMYDDISPAFDRAEQNGRRDCVVSKGR
jgi:hypothetical protein